MGEGGQRSTSALPGPSASGPVEMLESGPDPSEHGVLEGESFGGEEKSTSSGEIFANPGHLLGHRPRRVSPGGRSGVHGAGEEVVMSILRRSTVTVWVGVGGIPPVVQAELASAKED